MLTLFRWLLRLTVGLIVGAVVCVLLGWYFAVRSLPDYDATLRVDGIEAAVEIVRTTEDVPHVFAGNDHDAFFALGLAHAQDRLFQMVVLRRAVQGRLAEIYGPRAADADDLARRLGLWRHAQASLGAQDDRTRAALDAYAGGVNAWIQEVNASARGRGAPEFFLFRGDIAYWQPADSLAILKLLAAGSTAQLRAEVERAAVSLAAPQRAYDLVSAPGEPPMPHYGELFGPEARFPTVSPEPAQPWVDRLGGFVLPFMGGSGDSWAAEGTRTAAGGPLLAADAQATLTAPSLWYLARIELAGGGVIGGTVPGIPAVLSGRNPALAWGLTPAAIDDQDVVMEELQPGAPDRYLSPQGWTPFDTRQEVIRVLGGADRPVVLRQTRNGPVLPGGLFGLAGVTPSGHVAALRWTGLSDQDTTMTALVGLMTSPDRARAQKAVQGIIAPAVQVTLADAKGIAQTLGGEIPRRPADHPTGGRMPAPGRSASVRWEAPLPADAPERTTATDRGIVIATGAAVTMIPPAAGPVTAGQSALADTTGSAPAVTSGAAPAGALVSDQPASPVHATAPAEPSGSPASAAGGTAAAAGATSAGVPDGHDHDDPLRAARLAHLLATREVHSRDSFMEAQLDVISPVARTLLPLVGANLWFTGDAAAPGTPERQRQEALRLLAEWDGAMNEHLPEPLIYAAWMDELQDRLIRDELGPLAEAVSQRLHPAFIERVFRNTGGAAAWCDVIQSAEVEDCTTIARQALDAALVDLSARFGSNVASWRWGDLHQARHIHPGLGRIPGLSWVVNLFQPTSGDGSTLARAGVAGRGTAARFAQVTGAAYRGVYNLADPDSSVFIISTGQSGHPLSRHYDDLAELWRRGEYIGMSLDPALARAGAAGITRLEPASR